MFKAEDSELLYRATICRSLYRFIILYFAIYSVSSYDLTSHLPGASFAEDANLFFWNAAVGWLGSRVGVSDSANEYILVCAFIFSSGLGVIIWSLVDSKNGHDQTFFAWVRTLVRYSLSLAMLSYGLMKIVPVQFGSFAYSDLIRQLGGMTSREVLWQFMRVSPMYTIFAGAAEFMGGFLLLFRRTTLLGALISLSVLMNVVALNFCYDVQVKLASSHLLLMSIFVIAPEFARLYQFFILNGVATGSRLPSLCYRPWARTALTVLVFYFIGMQLLKVRKDYQEAFVNSSRARIAGLYEVEVFTVGTLDVSPLTTDTGRWRRVAIDNDARIMVQMMDNTERWFETTYTPSTSSVTFFDGAETFRMSYSARDAAHLVLQGTRKNESFSLLLGRIDVSKFELGGVKIR